MSTLRLFVNSHPMPCPCRLAQMTTETLRRMIQVRRSAIPTDRLQFAGVPSLATLTAELLRRERAMAVPR